MKLDEALNILDEAGFYVDLDGDADRVFPGAVKRTFKAPPEMSNILKLKDYFIDSYKDGEKYRVIISVGKTTRNIVTFEYTKIKSCFI